ncbi:hypothetical protein [Hyunsoonleella pacifica]|uniref:DUF4738 domain-containing protein n=1 Tax=Hyunsoonleella pacifica TaxID=1080224 RepID=A0A4Q9FR98_9FLAO|nr:hypothetical protein [Hyunsoonleella pacifica]TBN17894.1 hypothetical protein EYD46_06185 [Hyunsoonleella pacifica]GGD08012.1 hypothetical protein GCM10011368_07470 [Hyunsoonleella pacifica]
MRFNKKLFSVFLSLFIIVLFISCNNSEEQNYKPEFKLFNFQQQGWKSKSINHFINNINYTATEVPLQYYLLKSTNSNFKKVDSIYNVNSKERIIELEFQHTNQTDLLLDKYTNKSYDDAVKYIAFTIEKDFTVVTSANDTILCSGVNFERNFKVAPFKRVLLYFNNINPSVNIKLIYQDQLFDNGVVKFNFNEMPLKL